MKNAFLFFLLVFAMESMGANITDNTLNFGTGTASRKINFKGTPGYIGWDSATSKAVFSNDGTVVKALGSGAGGGAGAYSLLTNGGFEDGITVGFNSTSGKTTAATGTNALIDTTSAIFNGTALNDYLRTNYFTVAKGIRGTACEARFKYTGGDALNLSAKVETESGVVLATFNNGAALNVLPIHSLPDYESVFFKCPTEADITTLSTNGNIRLVIYQGTATDAAAITVDDVHLGSLIGLVESATPDTMSAFINGDGTIASESTDFINGNCSVTTNSYNCPLNTGITSTLLSCNITPNANTTQARTAQIGSASSTNIAYSTWNGATASALAVFLTCTKVGVDAKQSVQVYKSIPKTFDQENVFIAYIGSSDDVQVENYDFINGNCTDASSTGAANCIFNTGFFTQAPLCTVAISGQSISAVDRTAQITSNTATNVSFFTEGNAILANYDRVLTCIRTGSDIRKPTVQPVIIGQVTNSAAESSLTNVRAEGCSILNGGAASTSGTLCNGWVQSVSRSSIGQVTVNFFSTTFSERPVCSLTAAGAYHITIFGSSSTSFVVRTLDTANALADSNFDIKCIGKR